MMNAIKKHDIKNNDLEVNPNSTWLDPGIKNIQQLKDWMLVRLGYPLLNVELTDSQLNACIADGIALYSKYAYTPEKYLIVNTKFYKPHVGIDLHGYNIMSVKDIALQRDNLFGLAGNDMFFGPYAYFGQGVGSPGFGLGNQSYVGSWTTFHNIHEWFDVAKRLMGQIDWQYDKSTQTLVLMPEPKQSGDNFILLTVNQQPPIEEYYGNEYCRRIIISYAKILLGTVRKKFSSIQLIGGGSIDTSIGDEGKEELQAALEDLIKSESRGQCCFIA